jgi:hypothetical protein
LPTIKYTRIPGFVRKPGENRILDLFNIYDQPGNHGIVHPDWRQHLIFPAAHHEHRDLPYHDFGVLDRVSNSGPSVIGAEEGIIISYLGRPSGTGS